MKKLTVFLVAIISLSTLLNAKTKKVKQNEKKSETTVKNTSATSEESTKYFKDGYKGQVSTLVILEPEGQNVDKENEWLLSFIQTQLIDNFTEFSPIMISDRQNADRAQDEIGIQENGSFDEENIGATFGEAVGAAYMLTGQLINTGTSYTLSLRINNITKNITITSVKKSPVSAAEIKNGSIINKATEELLQHLGVFLTTAGREKLYGVDEQTLKQQESLSKGINASKRGTVVEAMQYYYDAAEYNVDNTEVYSRLNALQSAVSTGNLGDMARNEDEVYDYWKKTLSEAEQFFNNHPPYEIIYSTDLQRMERTRTELENKENSILIKIGLITSNSAKNTIATLKKGISDSPNVVKQVLTEWPENSISNKSNSWLYANNYTVTLELVNSLDKVISKTTTDINLVGPAILDYKPISVKQLDNLDNLVFSHVKSVDLTDDLTIRVVSVSCNSKIIPTDYIRISTVEGFKEPMLMEERIALERAAEEKRLARIEAEKKAREAAIEAKKEERKGLRQKIKNDFKEYLKHNRRSDVFFNATIKTDGYIEPTAGFRCGLDQPIFSHLYYGISGSYSQDKKENPLFDIDCYLGLNFYNSDKSVAFFTNAGAGYGRTSVNTQGLFVEAKVGLDYSCFEFMYTLQYMPFDGLFGTFTDAFDFGVVFQFD